MYLCIYVYTCSYVYRTVTSVRKAKQKRDISVDTFDLMKVLVGFTPWRILSFHGVFLYNRVSDSRRGDILLGTWIDVFSQSGASLTG